MAVFDPANEPTFQTASIKMATATTPTPAEGLAYGLITSSIATGLKSIVGAKKDGVYANGRCLVIRGLKHSDGVYELYFAVSIIYIFIIESRVLTISFQADEVRNPDKSVIVTPLPMPTKR